MSAPTPIVAGWLNIATKGLSLAARERISLEINAHFEEARDRHRAEGLDEAQALVEALRELGDADAAARRFRREHLTETEVRMIKGILPQRRGLAFWFGIVARLSLGSFLAANGSELMERHSHGYVRMFIMAVACLSLSSAYYLLEDQRKPRPNVSAVLLISSLKEYSYWMGLFFMMGVNWLSLTWIGVQFLLLGASSRAEICLCLKLRRMADVWQEMPPRVQS